MLYGHSVGEGGLIVYNPRSFETCTHGFWRKGVFRLSAIVAVIDLNKNRVWVRGEHNLDLATKLAEKVGMFLKVRLTIATVGPEYEFCPHSSHNDY